MINCNLIYKPMQVIIPYVRICIHTLYLLASMPQKR